MALTLASTASILSPEQVDALFIRPTLAQSIAAQVARIVLVSGSGLRVPVLSSDANASWTVESGEISLSDPTVVDIDIVFKKLAGLVTTSNELIDDSNGVAIQMVGESLARDTAKQIDSAYFGNTVTNGPSGLGSLSGVQTVDAGDNWTNLDAFLESISQLETVGAEPIAFVASPATALALAKLKIASGSNQNLLNVDATTPTTRIIAGVPLLVSAAVGSNMVWTIPKDRTVLAVRKDVSVTADASIFYSKDATAVRSITRVGLGFVHNAAVSKIEITP